MAALKETLLTDFEIRHTTIQCECSACSQGQTMSAEAKGGSPNTVPGEESG